MIESVKIRLLLIASAALSVFLLGFYIKGKFEEAEQAAVLRQQIKAGIERQDRINQIARDTEAALLTERQKSAMLKQKWSALRGDKNRTVCTFDADTVGLLRTATSAGDAPR